MTLRFSDDGPCFPYQFVDELLAGEVVFLCGTGMSAPQMPDFRRLVECTYENLGVDRKASEERAFEEKRFEEVLGSLGRRLADPGAVTRTVSALLAVPEHPFLDQHHTILRLSRDLDNRICVVTTNFDTLLERAAMEVEPNGTAREISFAGQALPAPGSSSFSGIVHIHGRLADGKLGLEQSQLVLTSADYGDAYMRSGWTSRFLFDLARCKAIALVGYSATDAPVRYFLNVLEADRARFSDLKTVYAFAEYECELENAVGSWGTLAVTPLPYCKINPDTEERDHAPLWRDLAALGNVAERPSRSRRERACAILERPATEASAESRSNLRWLFGGRPDLWSVALNSIADSEWFKFFQKEKLWPSDDLARLVAAWIDKDFQNPERFECALEWRESLGRPFAEELQQRLYKAQGLDKTWTRAWRFFCLAEHDRRNNLVTCYEMQKRFASGVVLDSDLRKAVGLLAPKLALRQTSHTLQKEDAGEPIRKLSDLAWEDLVVSGRDYAEQLIDALQGMSDRSGRILELATSELQSALALEFELEMISEEQDLNDFTVPSIESHAQNQHQEGVHFLIRVLVNCLSQAATLDRDHTRKLIDDWKRLPGRIGLRLCLHAMRDVALFDADEAISALLSISDVNFWSLRRELALVLRDRAGSASPELLYRVEERIRESGDTYYVRFPIEQGESDWRTYARDATVWLRLKMLQDAGVLSEIGTAELSSIEERRRYLDREVEDRDFFGVYSSGVRRVVDDQVPIVEVPGDDHLRVTCELAESPYPDIQQGWSAYCRSDPQGAFNALSKGDLTPANRALWSEFLGALASISDEKNKTLREDLSVRALEHLSKVDAGTLLPMALGLCEPILFAPRERILDIDGWLVKLWEIIEQPPKEPIDLFSNLYQRAINSPAGKLSETLLLEIEARNKADKDLTDAQRQLIKRIFNDATGAGLLGCAVLVRNVAFLLSVDRPYFVEVFEPCINAENEEGAALRAVMLRYGSITPEVTNAFGQAIIKGVVESEANDSHNATIAANILRPAFADLEKDYEVQWGLTAAEVANSLRKAQTAIRRGALAVLATWLQNDRAGAEKAWQLMAVPFFENVWPKEREFLDASFTRHLIDIALGAGQEFPAAFNFLRPYICPYDHEYRNLQAITNSEVPEKFPCETLDLVWLVCGPKSRGSLCGVLNIIDMLIKAKPDIEIDRRLQWLEQRAGRI